MVGIAPLVIFVVIVVWISINILAEWEQAVILTLGRYSGTKGPGLILVLPGIQKLVRVSLRVIVLDVPPQDIITRDNVSLKVNAVVYYRVIDPAKAVIQVENYLYATSQLSQTTLRSILGKMELDDLLGNREKINQELQQILDQHTEPWGVKVTNVEVKNVDLPEDMQRSMAAQAEAERERRAKVIHAEGEFQAAQKLAEAAAVMSKDPAAIQLRYLQTLTEIAADKNSTTIFPVPIDFLSSFMKKQN